MRMPDQIFYFVLNMSILGSVAGLIVLLLRRVRALPRFGVYLLWALPLIRFWVPFGFANRYCLLSLIARFTTKTVVVREALPGSWIPEISFSNSLQAAENYFPAITYKTDLLQDIFTVCGFIWAAVAAGAVLCAVLLYCFTRSALKNAEHVRDNIYRSDRVISPAVYGIFRPRIILPADIAGGDVDYILMHENIHIRRLDNFWRIFAVVTACVHWFNPLAWIFLRRFFADMELACDAGVLKRLDEGGKKEYAAALLGCSAGKTYYASAFGGAKTRLRIKSILSYKRLTLMSGLCFAALFIAVAAAVITNAVGG